jgi:hypothetical protein
MLTGSDVISANMVLLTHVPISHIVAHILQKVV